jgi:ring-1,2-phenylacetyl-CoA epoxidase subunit PaaC
LGDGTEESKDRMLFAIDELWQYTGELFLPAAFETGALRTLQYDITSLKDAWLIK